MICHNLHEANLGFRVEKLPTQTRLSVHFKVRYVEVKFVCLPRARFVTELRHALSCYTRHLIANEWLLITFLQKTGYKIERTYESGAGEDSLDDARHVHGAVERALVPGDRYEPIDQRLLLHQVVNALVVVRVFEFVGLLSEQGLKSRPIYNPPRCSRSLYTNLPKRPLYEQKYVQQFDLSLAVALAYVVQVQVDQFRADGAAQVVEPAAVEELHRNFAGETGTYLVCSSGTVWDLFWQYCTTSENNRAKKLREISPLPRFNGLSRMLPRFLLVRLILCPHTNILTDEFEVTVRFEFDGVRRWLRRRRRDSFDVTRINCFCSWIINCQQNWNFIYFGGAVTAGHLILCLSLKRSWHWISWIMLWVIS